MHTKQGHLQAVTEACKTTMQYLLYCCSCAFSAWQAQAAFGMRRVDNHQTLKPVRQECTAILAGLVNADRTV